MPTAAPRRTAPRRTALRAATFVLAGAAAVLALTGCNLDFQEDVCNTGEYPVLAVGGSGSACMPNGEEPAQGYARYPEGKVPRQLDDKWDVYWRTHTLDKDGNVIDAPDAP
ncbi:hypothetical protein LG634_26840 [Streptomyces bambusae]|uniref:SCO0607 family lipoprotein n=1 Tax=Streptomyces bambusae TaxID=1550616 RepID=UPI001CFDA5B8|nr:hypothetical protein [Streptomyces bambusae]MCB5168427.1 hypothetical protein [Streptomyces bambusae]